ncbi:MAG: NAD(P)H-quinone oxidoreductase [Vulcanimicrobiaceae bacterium]
MRVVEIVSYGEPDVLHVVERPIPGPKPFEVLIAVEAAGISRADVLQRRGSYPPPAGDSDVPGLEVAGTVAAVGESVTEWSPGDRVCALVNGGGYAEYAVAADVAVLPIPQTWTAVEAATLPENTFTVFDNVFTRARLEPGETFLVHGGTSGIGTTAIQLARAFGARVIATAGNARKCDACLGLGAQFAIDYRTQDFVAEVMRITAGRGANVVLDMVGGDYIDRDLAALALDGRIACIGAQRGATASIHLGKLLARRAVVSGSSMRPRSQNEKGAVAAAVRARVWPLLAARDSIRPVVDSTWPLEDAPAAHRRMESGEHFGKIVLTTAS